MNFQHKLTIDVMTGHREKAGQEDGDVGVSLKITGAVKLQDLAPLLGCEHTHQLLDHLYDAEGTPHTENITLLDLKVEHKDVGATLSVGPQRHKFKDAVLDSIVLTPGLSRVIELQARLKVHPTEAQGGWLLMNLRKEVIVDLRGGATIIAAKSKGDDDGQPQLPLPDTKSEKKDAKPPKAGKAARSAETA